MISTVILTKNEENTLAACIESVSFSSEVLVIDNGSTDQTIEIAKQRGAHVIEMSETGDFSELRKRGLTEAKNNWVLFIDADERVPDELKNEILLKTQNDTYASYYIKRRDHWWGRTLRFGEVRSAYVKGFIRLAQKESGHWSGAVHEVFQTNKKTGTLDGYLEHYPHPSLKKFISDINDYSSRRAGELFSQGKTSSIAEIICVPPIKFFYTYFFQWGFLDGVSGFVYSFLMSFHSFLVRSKLYIMKS